MYKRILSCTVCMLVCRWMSFPKIGSGVSTPFRSSLDDEDDIDGDDIDGDDVDANV